MRSLYIVFIVFILFLLGYQQVNSMDKMEKNMKNNTEKSASAVFAGGCFWCTESDFEKVEGVIEVISGYTGGQVKNPTYKQVSGGGTGHIAAVRKEVRRPLKQTGFGCFHLGRKNVDNLFTFFTAGV